MRTAGSSGASVAYRHPKRGKAHALYGDPQPDPWDQAYSGLTLCGFRLRYAVSVPLDVTAPEDRCRVCWPTPPSPEPEPGR